MFAILHFISFVSEQFEESQERVLDYLEDLSDCFETVLGSFGATVMARL